MCNCYAQPIKYTINNELIKKEYKTGDKNFGQNLLFSSQSEDENENDGDNDDDFSLSFNNLYEVYHFHSITFLEKDKSNLKFRFLSNKKIPHLDIFLVLQNFRI